MTEVHPLRKWRRETQTTLSALAGTLNISASHLSEIERGLNTPSPQLARKLSAETSIAPRVFLPELAEMFEGGGAS